MASKHLIVAAIDFGTTYSGWAFSFNHEFESNPTKVSAKVWRGGTLASQKGPTCALIRQNGKELDKFGYEAESKYADLASENEHKEWYFFKRFKMCLWKEGIHREATLEDESGKKLSAKTVFALSIKFLKDDLMKTSNDQISGLVKPDDIHWVLTVPAIWNDAAKQFMREAAQEAGIAHNMLSIALEPEAASVFCRHLKVDKSGPGKVSLSSFGEGKRYLVLDAGGGTVDITVHEVGRGGNLKELHKASGGAWGGTTIDDSFVRFLTDLAGSAVMTRFKERHMDDFIDLLRDFEIKKRDLHPSKEGKIKIKMPLALTEVVFEMKDNTFKDVIQNSKYGSKVKLTGDKFMIDAAIVKGFFKATCDSITSHVSDLLSQSSNRGVEAILMVGGFSESPMLQEAIKNSFSSIKLIVPDEAGLAVLKGAVIYGHSPASISERVCKYTYGVGTTEIFDENKHDLSKRKVYSNGEVRCIDVFSTLVKAGQTLEVGKAQEENSYSPIFDDQDEVNFDVYAARDLIPKYTTDPECRKLGSLSVPISGKGKDRKVYVKMIFGGTEIDVECREVATGKITHLAVDFL